MFVQCKQCLAMAILDEGSEGYYLCFPFLPLDSSEGHLLSLTLLLLQWLL